MSAITERTDGARTEAGAREARDGFPDSYRARYASARLASDLECALAAAGATAPVITFENDASGEPRANVRVFHRGDRPALSATLPRIEDMGLEVLDYFTCPVAPDSGPQRVQLHDFTCRLALLPVPERTAIDAFNRVFAAVFANEAESDGFNRLALAAAFGVREIAVLRAYARYMRQLRVPYGDAYVASAIAGHPAIARDLMDLFLIRFDPDTTCDREAAARDLKAGLHARFETVDRIEDEEILRRYLELVEATMRTNFFQRDGNGAPKAHLAFKFDCARIADMPAPRPYREIYVCSPTVEGVHLRGGPVARGGLRYSDRARDFRTEILDLFKAQQVKNAVIVPAGAKGGFVLRHATAAPPADRDAVISAYRTFVCGLLDLTDTIEQGAVRAMDRRTVRRDGDDAYLVVAADKGTATFSDVANGIALEYGYWLADAFASGGSAGYDHKKMGITARGAWEAVRRHFRELGTDVDAAEITVAGVGDMSGDVFGNGMLLSRHLRLVAAFDHRHIFLDPDPDAANSFAERRRLFEAPRSSWADYDRSAISAGGGVFPRSAKRIELSPAAQTALGCSVASVTPEALIRTILTAPVDLLWFGGIGTYVKAAAQSHEVAGDHANDRVRVDASELRCRVIGEGANLALTQQARIEFALGRGRINTDAIDNAAGVNCSDHEVNIKIVLNEAVRQGRFTAAERNALLAEMTDDVARLVLRDNYLQTQALTVTESQSGARVDRHLRLMAMLERNGQLDRRLAGLPDDDTLGERHARGQGLTRPEIAELLAHTKMSVAGALLASTMPDDPLLNRDLVNYFPATVRERCRGLIEAHPLRREIIVTRVVNSMINRVGSGFVADMMERAACDDAGVARAYAVARDVFGLREVWRAIEALDNLVPAALQTELLHEAGALVEHATAWLLEHEGPELGISSTVALYSPSMRALAEALPGVLPGPAAKAFDQHAAELARQGVPFALARRVAAFRYLQPAGDVARLARRFDVTVETAAAVYYEAGQRSGLDGAKARLAAAAGADRWEREALGALLEDLHAHHARFAGELLAGYPGEPVAAAIARFDAARGHRLARLAALAEAICADANVSYPRIMLLNHGWRRTLEASK